MIKDHEGFMWFATWDGINRFDGHSFVAYKSSPFDRYQLSSNRIDRIAEDQSDHLWVQTADNQIYRFDKKTEQFLPLSALVTFNGIQKIVFTNILHISDGWVWLQSKDEGIFCVSQSAIPKGQVLCYRKETTEEYKLPSNTIKFFHKDNEDRIWIGTTEGLSCLERSESDIYTNSKIRPPGFAGINLTQCTEDAENIYFGTEGGSLIIFEKKRKTFTVHKIAAGRINDLLRSRKKAAVYACSSVGEVIEINLSDLQMSTNRYHPAENLSTLFEDQSGALWMQPEKWGAIRFDPQNRSFQLFSLYEGKPVRNSSNRFFRVVEDYNGTVWICVKSRGLGYYNPVTKRLESVLLTTDGNNYPLPDDVNNTYYDNAGVLWLKTSKPGILKIVLQDNNFHQHPVLSQGSTESENEVKGICFDNKSRLWLGVKRDKLFIYQNSVLIKDLFVNEPPDGVVGVYSILQDSRGNIWLGTKGNGLFKATPVNKEETKYRLTHFLPNKNQADSLPSNSIYALLEDKQGRVWMGTMGDGLVLVEDSPTTTRFTQNGNAFKNYPKSAFRGIRHMALDEEGNIWIGTTNGLLVLDANDSHSPVYQYRSYSTVPGDKESLSNNDIQFIHRDQKNQMWLATSGGGFCQAMGDKPFQSLRFRNYTTKDGLPHDYILSCAEDGQGNLWLATENGLSKFNPQTKTFRNYDSYDGLPKTTFSEASVTKQGMGRKIFFGTTDGYLAFEPERINSLRIRGNIAYTNLQINNENVGPGANEGVLKTNINYVSELTLQYNQNIISIDYAILDSRAGDRQPFAYRLVGFDSTWHNNREFRRATYTNLPPGHYVFEVKSLSTDLYSNQPYKRLSITILPPWWKTGWAYSLYIILTGILLYFIRRNALEKMRLRNKIAVEQKLAALKMNFFTNISHELRTPLTLIVNPLEQIAQKAKLPPELSSYMDIARKNAARMVRFVNQLLDLRKVQSDKATLHLSRVEVVNFIKKIADYFTEAARSKNINLEILSDQKGLIVWVDAEKLDVVIYNLFGNAIKFTPEGKAIHVYIRSIAEEQSFSVAVYDQGPGVPKEDLEAIFELFQEGGKTSGGEMKGTGIGLALSREFVNLHGGSIWAENNEDGGLTVTVKLKLGPVHYKEEEYATDLPETVPVIQKPIEQQILPQLAGNGSLQGEQAPLVLLVEDNDEFRTFIKGQLGGFYRVETARDGEEGLQKALNLVPDLIVSDIMMPKMDGIQMLDKIKNDVNTSHIPVVLLSAKYSIQSQIEGLQYGADYYITKPFNNEFLIASIDNLLRQRKKLFEALVENKKLVAPSPKSIVITSKDETFLKDIISVVEEKMAETDFTIDVIAESMAMSHRTFHRKFRSLTGQTPVEFVRDMRLQRAKQLLDAGANSVSEVAYEVGFSVPSYFSTCFKEKYLVSPSDYIKAKTT